LRNIALTAPYFHTGKAWDLRQAVAVMGTSQLGTQLTDDEIDKITAFLESLTGEQPKVAYPILPPSVATTPRRNPDRLTFPDQRWRNGRMPPDRGVSERRSPVSAPSCLNPTRAGQRPRVPSLKAFGHRPSAPADRSLMGRYPKPCTPADLCSQHLWRLCAGKQTPRTEALPVSRLRHPF
jgi:hypothetical protein